MVKPPVMSISVKGLLDAIVDNIEDGEI